VRSFKSDSSSSGAFHIVLPALTVAVMEPIVAKIAIDIDRGSMAMLKVLDSVRKEVARAGAQRK